MYSGKVVVVLEEGRGYEKKQPGSLVLICLAVGSDTLYHHLPFEKNAGGNGNRHPLRPPETRYRLDTVYRARKDLGCFLTAFLRRGRAEKRHACFVLARAPFTHIATAQTPLQASAIHHPTRHDLVPFLVLRYVGSVLSA